MDEGELRELLTRLGARKVRSGRSWVSSSCLFESARHSGGQDDNPSFGIKLAPLRSSRWNCKGCHVHGDNIVQLIIALHANNIGSSTALAETFQWVLARDRGLEEAKFRDEERLAKARSRPTVSYDWQSSINSALVPTQDGKVLSLLPYESLTPAILPESHLDGLRSIPPEVFAYLESSIQGARNLQRPTIESWELGFSVEKRRIVIPIRNYEQHLIGISGRRLPKLIVDPDSQLQLYRDEKKGTKYLHSTGFRRDLVLFGESKVIPGRPGFMVEGFFDVIGLWESGYSNAVAIMGSYPSSHQIEKIVKLFTSMTIIGDGDPEGRKMALRSAEILKSRLPTRIVEPPVGKDPAELTIEEKIFLLGPPDRPV